MLGLWGVDGLIWLIGVGFGEEIGVCMDRDGVSLVIGVIGMVVGVVMIGVLMIGLLVGLVSGLIIGLMCWEEESEGGFSSGIIVLVVMIGVGLVFMFVVVGCVIISGVLGLWIGFL